MEPFAIELEIEGLAAQLYLASESKGPFTWWHLLNDETKIIYRRQAVDKITEYRSKCTQSNA
jgi:hypothetical protein